MAKHPFKQLKIIWIKHI